MHSLQQQGEVILETLVERLIEQLQEDAGSVSADVSKILGDRLGGPTLPQPAPAPPRQEPTQPTGAVQQPPAQPAPAPVKAPATPAPETNVLVTGLILALLSSFTISFQNIVTKVILSKQTLLSVTELGGYLSPSPGNSLLILVMRMLLVVPLMGFVLAPLLYPNTWRDIRGLWNPEKRGSLWIVFGSGMFLFMSQFCIYIALGNMPTGVAITLFFIFPPVTALLAWVIFGARPTFIFGLATITIYLGCFLTVSAKLTGGPQGNLLLGVFTAIGAGLTFAGYVILTQLSGKKLKLHPAPFSVINFSVILVLAVLTLPIFPYTVEAQNWVPLWVGTIMLAATTLVGYALNNFAIPMIGGPLASVVAATGPGLTSLMALIFIGEGLGLNEWLGVIIVTLWVLGISVDNMSRQKAAQAANK
jgi:drug/metabolite transporter (DMT)-like permease